MSDNWVGRMGEYFRKPANIPSATPVVVAMAGAPLPCTVTLKSAAVGRLIEASTDGGTEYFTVPLDMSSATQIAAALLAPVTHVRVTGTTNDTWSIQ